MTCHRRTAFTMYPLINKVRDKAGAMAWLAENWIWVLFGIAFIAMHLFGHGGHGGHGKRRGEDRGDTEDKDKPTGH